MSFLLSCRFRPNRLLKKSFSLAQRVYAWHDQGRIIEPPSAATRNAANYLGVLDSLGTVEKGKLADLVLLDANPLADIGNTNKINAVVVGGKLIDSASFEEMLAKVEAANKNYGTAGEIDPAVESTDRITCSHPEALQSRRVL